MLKVIPRQEVEEAYQRADKEDDNWQQEGPDLADQKEQSKEFGQKNDKYDERPRERNGWGVIEEEIPEQWPSYTTQTVVDLH